MALEAFAQLRAFLRQFQDGHDVMEDVCCMGAWQELPDATAAELGAAVAATSRLHSLSLDEVRLPPEAIAIVASGLARNGSLTSLALVDCDLGDLGLSALAAALPTTSTLRHLRLDNCCLRSGGDGALASALALNSSLTSLRLTGNELTPQAAGQLTNALALHAMLQRIDLSCQAGIGDAAAAGVAAALGARCGLESVRLVGCGMTAKGCDRLAGALRRNSTVKSLDIGWNDLGDAAAGRLGAALGGNATLEELGLDGVPLKSGGAHLLAWHLIANWSLASVALLESCVAVDDVLRRNRKYQAERRRIGRTLGAWRTVINVHKYKRYLRRKNTNARRCACV